MELKDLRPKEKKMGSSVTEEESQKELRDGPTRWFLGFLWDLLTITSI